MKTFKINGIDIVDLFINGISYNKAYLNGVLFYEKGAVTSGYTIYFTSTEYPEMQQINCEDEDTLYVKIAEINATNTNIWMEVE